MTEHIAHIRKSDGAVQTLEEHLMGTAGLARGYMEKFGLGDLGELLGLLHDIGKYSKKFQDYISSGDGAYDQDSDEADELTEDLCSSKKSLKGKIDHSTSGSQIAWNLLQEKGGDYLPQIAALSLASHHSGLIDNLTPDGIDIFTKRMSKDNSMTNLEEVKSKIHPEINKKIKSLIEEKAQFMSEQWNKISKSVFLKNLAREQPKVKNRFNFAIGLWARIIFSCLIDADRTDTIDFECKRSSRTGSRSNYTSWEILAERLENHLNILGSTSNSNDDVRRGRAEVSDSCKSAAERDTGLFTLTVPTGGGKTLASLRFALNHAKKHKLDRIFYIVPYTTIIDQNAEAVRKILEHGKDIGRVVLECHSNLSSERETWLAKLLSGNWDAPVVFTTSVQFLEALFAGGTRSVRRMHQLARSVIIFDEVQTIQVKMIHMFCNAVNFLVDHCNSTAVLCTATQPLLNGVEKKSGALHYSEENEIIPDVSRLFDIFRRVEFFYKRKPGGYSNDDIAELAIKECEITGSSLVIVNTTRAAKEVYRIIKGRFENVIHLSAKMCPAHRVEAFKKLNECLEAGSPLICVSTQVIEAGVDIDFGSVIRYMAGLDSIAQAAGRCNRHGKRVKGRVILVNPEPENDKIDSLEDIATGRDTSQDRLAAFQNGEVEIGDRLLTKEFIDEYYRHYFHKREGVMSYDVKVGRDDTLLNILSGNNKAVDEYGKKNKVQLMLNLKQSFKTAGKSFKAIDAPTRSIIVPYKDGEEIIAQLCSDLYPAEKISWLKKAQRYSVNVYPGDFEKLLKAGAVCEIEVKTKTGREAEKLGIWFLQDGYYNPEFGLDMEERNITGSGVFV